VILQSYRSTRRMEASFKKARPLRLRFSQYLAKIEIKRGEQIRFVLQDDGIEDHGFLLDTTENALADTVRFFHIDALSSSVGFKVDFDMALLVLASGLYRIMAGRMRGYDEAQARQIFRDLIDMPADVAITDQEITVRFHRRAHPPIVPPQVCSTNRSQSLGGTVGSLDSLLEVEAQLLLALG